MLVSTSRAVTVAPGTTAPVVSETVPRRVDNPSCPQRQVQKNRAGNSMRNITPSTIQARPTRAPQCSIRGSCYGWFLITQIWAAINHKRGRGPEHPDQRLQELGIIDSQERRFAVECQEGSHVWQHRVDYGTGTD